MALLSSARSMKRKAARLLDSIRRVALAFDLYILHNKCPEYSGFKSHRPISDANLRCCGSLVVPIIKFLAVVAEKNGKLESKRVNCFEIYALRISSGGPLGDVGVTWGRVLHDVSLTWRNGPRDIEPNFLPGGRRRPHLKEMADTMWIGASK